MKEKNKTLEKELNKMDIRNPSDAEVNTGYKDAQRTHWELQQHKKDTGRVLAKMEEAQVETLGSLHNQKKIRANLKAKTNQICRKIKLHGTLTTKEIKKHSSRPVGGAEMGSQAGGAGSPTFPCR